MPRLTLMELRLFLREPLAVLFSVAFAPVLVAILGLAYPGRIAQYGGLRIVDVYVPISIALILGMLGLTFLPSALAAYRERGVLRRLATTPVAPAALLAAQLVMSLLVTVVSTALVLAVGRLGFGVALPRQLAGFTLALVLGAAAVFSIGLVVAAVIPNGRAAQSIGSLLLFPLLFFAGLWSPRAAMPDVMRHISDFTPMGAAVQALQDGWTGQWPAPLALLVMAAYVLLFGVVASRTFRWQ
jgi:ABC-2 type transport system permease protein